MQNCLWNFWKQCNWQCMTYDNICGFWRTRGRCKARVKAMLIYKFICWKWGDCEKLSFHSNNLIKLGRKEGKQIRRCICGMIHPHMWCSLIDTKIYSFEKHHVCKIKIHLSDAAKRQREIQKNCNLFERCLQFKC